MSINSTALISHGQVDKGGEEVGVSPPDLTEWVLSVERNIGGQIKTTNGDDKLHSTE